MDKQSLRRADLVTSYILHLFSAWIFIMSIINFLNPWGRDFSQISAEEFKLTFETWYQQPALLPFICSILLAVCASGLRKRALKDGARIDFIKKASIIKAFKSREFRVALTIIGLTAFYLFVLIPGSRSLLDIFPTFRGFPFAIATFIYLSSFMAIFSEKRLKPMITSFIVSVIGTAAITYGFGYLALIPLP